jgi:hypothetical protein
VMGKINMFDAVLDVTLLQMRASLTDLHIAYSESVGCSATLKISALSMTASVKGCSLRSPVDTGCTILNLPEPTAPSLLFSIDTQDYRYLDNRLVNNEIQ